MSQTSTDIWPVQIERLIAARNPIIRDGGTLLVSTDVTMPSGTGVVVLVCGGRSGETVSVSDGGAAIREVRELGYSLRETDLGVIRRAVKTWDMSFGDGEIRAPLVPLDDVGWAISLVANVAREVSAQLLKVVRLHHAATFKDRVNGQLAAIFGSERISRGHRIAGSTSRYYRFDYGIRLQDGRHLTLDLPEPEPSAITATIVRNIDVKRRGVRGLIQAIVWNDEIHWQGEVLDQLRLAGVPLFSGSTIADQLPKLTQELVAAPP